MTDSPMSYESEFWPISHAMVLSALGVVFGDIAISPLYALQSAFGTHGVKASHDNVLGLLSLVFCALIIVVSCKYVAFIMRANNKGEGGQLGFAS